MLYMLFRQINIKNSKMSPEEMYKWINDNQVLDILIDPNNYSMQSISYTACILQFYIIHGFLNDQDIDTFWSATKLSLEAKQ